MEERLTIGELAKRAGLNAKTVRFYEDEGLLPRARRSASGYRLYGDADVARLQLVRRMRLLGLSLPATKTLVQRALSGDCALFGEELMASIAAQRESVARQIEELEALRSELDRLDAHIRHCCDGCDPGTMASECGFCGLIEAEKSSEGSYA
jgi:DNA-binding transcriptional MerR regulator